MKLVSDLAISNHEWSKHVPLCLNYDGDAEVDVIAMADMFRNTVKHVAKTGHLELLRNALTECITEVDARVNVVMAQETDRMRNKEQCTSLIKLEIVRELIEHERFAKEQIGSRLKFQSSSIIRPGWGRYDGKTPRCKFAATVSKRSDKTRYYARFVSTPPSGSSHPWLFDAKVTRLTEGSILMHEMQTVDLDKISDWLTAKLYAVHLQFSIPVDLILEFIRTSGNAKPYNEVLDLSCFYY